jgi:hypothetical protein
LATLDHLLASHAKIVQQGYNAKQVPTPKQKTAWAAMKVYLETARLLST